MSYRLLELRRAVENPNYYLMKVEERHTFFGVPISTAREIEFYGSWGTWKAVEDDHLAPKKVRRELETLLEKYLSSR